LERKARSSKVESSKRWENLVPYDMVFVIAGFFKQWMWRKLKCSWRSWLVAQEM